MQLVKIKGTGFGVIRRSDGRYVVKWRDEYNKARQTTFTRTADANNYCRRKYREWPGRSNITDISIRDMLNEYLEMREGLWSEGELADNTIVGDRSAARRIIDYWDGQSAGELVELDVSRWYSSMRTELKSSSIKQYAQVLRGAYRHAMRPLGALSHLQKAPVPTVPVKDVKVGEAFTDDEVRGILTAAPHHYHAFFCVLASTGMRIEEVCRLDMANFKPRYVEDPDTGDWYGALIGGIKTDAGRDRVMILPVWVTRILTAAVDGQDSGPLLVNTRGRRVNADVFRLRIWHPLMGRLGLDGAIPHWFRHTAATRAGEQGRTLFEIQSQFGWKDARTANRYVKPHRKGVLAIAQGFEEYGPGVRAVGG